MTEAPTIEMNSAGVGSVCGEERGGRGLASKRLHIKVIVVLLHPNPDNIGKGFLKRIFQASIYTTCWLKHKHFFLEHNEVGIDTYFR